MTQYENYERSQGWAELAFGTFTAREAGYFAKEMASLDTGPPKSGSCRILEIGFGNGAFMGWCRVNGIPCDGLEINPVQIAKAKEGGFVAFASFDEIGDSSYDLVVGFDILEHVESTELAAFLGNVKDVCRPGSAMIFRFPNGDNPFSLWMQNGDVTHRNFIGSGMISQASTLAGLTLKRVSEPATALDSLSIIARVKIVLGLWLRQLVGRFLIALFMSGQKNIRFSPNLLVELRKD